MGVPTRYRQPAGEAGFGDGFFADMQKSLARVSESVWAACYTLAFEQLVEGALVPLYEYKCLKCGRNTEKIENVNGPHLKKCPHCGGKVESVITAPSIQFKGAGWYVTDYAGKKPSSDGEKADKAGSEAKDAASKEKDSPSKEKDSPKKETTSKESKEKKPATKK
jgi:putative FmdB family regulatory protein